MAPAGGRLDVVLGAVRRLAAAVEQRPRYAAVALAVIVVGLSAPLQRYPTVLDSDAFYHARIATLLAHGQLPRTFPALPLTIFADGFTDHHLLYHAALVPFVRFGDPLVGVKVAAVVFATTATVASFLAMRRIGVIGAFWWAILAATSWPFLFRLNLVKALPLSITLYLVGLVAAREERSRLLVAVSFLYVWAYGGWPLLPLTIAFYATLLVLRRWGLVWSAVRLVGSTAAGSLAGLALNPYFPQNLQFYWRQVFEIALTPTAFTTVGAEWLPYPFLDLYSSVAPLFLGTFLVAATAVFGWAAGRRPPVEPDVREFAFRWTVTAVAAGFFVMTLLARRYVEYFVPVGFLALALSATALVRSGRSAPARAMLAEWYAASPRRGVAVALLLALFLAVYSGQARLKLQGRFREGIPFTYLRDTASWVRRATPPGAVVFNVRWDDFTALYYHHESGRYGIGLDLRLFAGDTPARVRAWEELYRGTAADPARTLRTTFGAAYVVVSARDVAAAAALERRGFPVRYRDREATVYAVPE